MHINIIYYIQRISGSYTPENESLQRSYIINCVSRALKEV